MNLLKHNALYQESWNFKMENNIFVFKYSKRITYCGT